MRMCAVELPQGGLRYLRRSRSGIERSHTTAHSETQLHTTSDWEFNSRRTTKALGGEILMNAGFNYEISEQQSLVCAMRQPT